MWKEVVYVPDEPGEKKGLKAFRYLVIRLPLKFAVRRMDLFDPEANKPDYLAVVTNREGPGDALIDWHREKCGTIEHVHDQKKNDVGNRLSPSGRFRANAAWYRLGSLALNLHQFAVRGCRNTSKRGSYVDRDPVFGGVFPLMTLGFEYFDSLVRRMGMDKQWQDNSPYGERRCV